jgi:hypothetical protein
VPDLSAPLRVPDATTPLAVARKPVICAVTDTLEEVLPVPLAVADGAMRPVKTSAIVLLTASLRIVFLLGLHSSLALRRLPE